MNITFLRYIFFVLLITLVVASCKVTHSYQSPDVSTTGLYRDSVSADTNTIANLRWNEVFTDPALQSLVREGINRNLDLRIAFTRVEQAQAFYLQSGAAFLPTINGNTSIARSKFSAGQGFGARPSITQYQFGLTSGWEADIWGRLAANRRASLANFLQSEAAVRAVQTSVVSSIANFYYLLLALDQQLLIQRKQ
jgi:outer membrane protein TolC